MSPDSASRRVRVTSPRASAGRPRRVAVTSEIDAQTRIGEIYMTSLLRAQLRLAILVVLTVGVLVAGLPFFFWLFPSLAEIRVFGMPVPWVLLGFAVYPFLVVVGWFYVRAAERNEHDFTDVVERS